MENGNGENKPVNFLVSTSPRLRAKYKRWCKDRGIAMNDGFNLFMQTVTSKKRKYKIQQRIMELAK